MTPDWRQTGEYSPHARRLAEILRGVNLLDTDKLLDDARRLTWLKVFTGFDSEAVKQCLDPSDIALQIAASFSGLNLMVVDDLLTQIRTLLWIGHFTLMPNTRYGKEHATMIERDEQPVDPAKMN